MFFIHSLANNEFGKYQWKSYEETYNLSLSLARGMEFQKVAAVMDYQGQELRLVGIFAKTREEWLVTDIACWHTSVTNVPIYDTLGDESVSWIFEQTQLCTVFIGDHEFKKIMDLKRKNAVKTLKCIICYDELTQQMSDEAAKEGLRILSYADIIAIGNSPLGLKQVLRPCKPEGLITICYTSGTTARSKGAELTHGGFHANAHSCFYGGCFFGARAGLMLFSYLPLAHVFERVCTYSCIVGGMKLAYYHGDNAKLVDDLAIACPDVLVGVPRVFSRVYGQIMSGISKITGFMRKVVERGIEIKLANLNSTGKYTHWLYDRLVFKKIRNVLGGRVTLFVSAAAPLDEKMMKAMKIFFSAYLIQGYGQTETAGAISISLADDPYALSLGPPGLWATVKTVDVPEMNYFSTDKDKDTGISIPRGELCVKGLSVMKGYFADIEKTKQAFDADGWLHTGDIVCMLPPGTLKIIDRKKNLFKMAQGEYISPEKIENVLQYSKWVAQMVVHGDGLFNYLVAIVVPKKDTVLAWGESEKIKGSFEDLCKNPLLSTAILKDLEELGSKSKLSRFELIRKLVVTPEAFTIENGSMTPTFKIKRNIATKMYEKELKDLYAGPPPAEEAKKA